MEPQNTPTAEIPNFKLAKVGKDRERKRGAAGWMGGRGAGSAFSGAMGGSGAAGGGGLLNFAGMSLGKALLMLLAVAGFTAASWQMGRLMDNSAQPGGKGAPKVFADRDGKYGDTSGVIKQDNSIPNSLGYVSGSSDGLTPEERAKKAAEDEAARKAAEEAQKKADAEANKEAPTPASNVPDANSILAGADASAKKGLTGGKFGQLSSSFGGGGLSGGSGLSGGIGRGFGGSGANNPTRAQNGALSSFRNPGKPSAASAPHAVAGHSTAKGFARRQLDNAFAQSRQAVTAGKSENAAANAGSAFDNNAGQGSVIAGPGVSNGGGAGGATSAGTNPNEGGGGGGAINSGPTPCTSDQTWDQNGNCVAIPKGNEVNQEPGWQKLVSLAEKLMLVIAVLAIVAMLVEKIPVYGAIIANYIKMAIGILGLVVTGLGIAIMAQHQILQGGILTALGAFTAYMAFSNVGSLSSAQAAESQATSGMQSGISHWFSNWTQGPPPAMAGEPAPLPPGTSFA